MDTKRLTADLSVSPQITVDDVPMLKAAGFRAIICNRPDGEAEDQPRFAEIADAAQKVGIKALYLPVVAGSMADEDARAFRQALTDLPGPVLAYCRSGARSANLWTLSQTE